MTKVPYTQKSLEQYRGPNDSTVFNQNSEDVYQDLVYLHNKSNEVDADSNSAYSAIVKEIYGLAKKIEDLKAEILASEANTTFFTGPEMLDTDHFEGTVYEVDSSDQLSYDSRFNIYALPKNTSASVSRLKFLNANGEVSLPPSLKMVVLPVGTSIDSDETKVRSSQPYDAVLAEAGKVWERNVSSVSGLDAAEMDLIFNLPEDLTSTEYANNISFVPYPMFEVDILGIYYTTEIYPDLSLNGSTWTPLNDDAKYYEDDDAVGHIPPGAWSGDEILNAAPLSFTFPNKKITAVRIRFQRRNPYDFTTEFAFPQNVYTYGLSYLDVRYDKFLEEGKALFKITPQEGDTISSIDQVAPYIYNVGQEALADVFSYRVIWETSVDSGTYTTTPVALSEKVWLEVTLTKDDAGNYPALNGFKVVYS